jgi:hypothetical protein
MAAVRTRFSSYDERRPKRQQYEGILTRLKSERASFDAHWRDLADFVRPRRARFTVTDRNRGDKRNQNIINSTATFASRTLASGLHAGLTSPARPWFKLGTPDPDLAKFPPVREWLHVVTQRMTAVFLTTNLYQTLPTVYGDLGNFGTGAMSMLPDSKDLFRTWQYPIGSYWLGQDTRGNATTFVREYELTVRQIVTEFLRMPGTRLIDWNNGSTTVRNLWDQGDYEATVRVTWVVTPNEDADPRKPLAKFLPWSSCWFETGEDKEYRFLRESGFRTFPVFAPRWEVTDGDSYGTDCPGMTALGDVRQLQGEEKAKGRGIQKMVDPALVGPASLMGQKTSLISGDVTYVDVREGQQGLKPIHDVRMPLQELRLDMAAVEYRIQRAYFEDLFLMLARADQGQPITAEEVRERREEKLLGLGPVLEHANDELLEPAIDRAYAMMDERGLIPPAPDELDGVELKVEYLSILAQAQKLVGLAGTDRFVGTVVPLIQTFPEARHKVNVYQLVDDYGEMTGVDPRLIVSTDEAKAAAEAEGQQKAALAQAAQAQATARAAKDASAATMSDGTSLLDTIAGAAEGGAIA